MRWYPSRWFGWGRWPQYAEFGPLARHVRYVERTARRLARQQFHLMVLNGPALEKKQALLFRCVDVGAELYAMVATCVQAQRDVLRHPADLTPYDLAGTFCNHSRRKIEQLFAGVRSNDDAATYRLARGVLDGKYAWLEKGIIDVPGAPSAGEAQERPMPREAVAGR